MSGPPVVEQVGGLFSAVSGTFYRAVDPRFVADALTGSRVPGRYSPPELPALYLGSSPEGVDAAMIAHRGARATELELLEVRVDADRIVDLRDQDAVSAAGIDLGDAMAAWQDDARAGREARPWGVRRALEGLGANGLIDPSRQRPGLWHLTLFRWNAPGAPRVESVGGTSGNRLPGVSS